MTASGKTIHEGCIVIGSLFNEPMRVETVRAGGDGTWTVGLVGTQSERFRKVTLTVHDLQGLTIFESGFTYDGDGHLLRLGLQAYSLGIAWEFDPYFGLSVSRVDPLPHQLEAIYDYLLKLARVRFLLADDAGAGNTIMAGLLIRELQLRGLAERILVVCPANLSFQWQRELTEKFDEKFLVLKGGDIRDQFGVNQWLEQKKVITSLDLAKRTEILPGLRQVHWDLIIVDEAHRMSWTPPARKTARYALGELLRDTSDNILLLTATPHKGDPVNFSRFLQLLDPDVYADVRSIREAMERRRAPFYLRRTKEAMVYFPERRSDGTWAAEKIFKKRIPHTVDFQIDGPEFDLYREITRFVKRQSAKAAAQGDDTRARAVGFLMSLYQRRLASSTYAMRHSLENRVRRLDECLKNAQELSRHAPPDLPDPEELEEMEESERERLENLLEAITLAGNAEQVREEIAELRGLAEQARAVEQSDAEAKLSKLRDLLHQEGFFDDPDKRLLLFTEFKDTLDYLVEKLKSWGFKVGCIHGGMKPGSRDEVGTRLYSEQQFREGAIQVLVATEAAGEGINLQVCHVLFNYDIPWNPNRLEQRMGRIHRYGQREDCLIFNFVATNTIEGRVLQRLLTKLQEIRDALEDDAVFNVVGEVLPATHIERILRDFYRARVVDGLGHVVHERLFAVELAADAEPCLREPNMLGNFSPAAPSKEVPAIAAEPEASEWLHKNALQSFLEETREERLAEVQRIAEHVELSLTELLQRADEEIGKAIEDKEKGVAGADGRLAQAENRHAELLARRERRRQELDRQRSLSLQAVERIASVLVIPHPERGAPDVRRIRPNLETEVIAMQVVMEHEQAQGRQVYDVHEKNLGYDITSLALNSGELRLIEVKGLAAATGTILLTPNERRVAEDRRDCYWLYVVTNCTTNPIMQEPIKDPARFPWQEVSKVAHYWLEVNAMTRPMMIREDSTPYGGEKP